jgi:hypothetical protein
LWLSAFARASSVLVCADEADTSSLQPRHTVGVLSAVATAHPPTQLQRR